jgi:putative aldouronate transport system permease protein
MKLRYRLENLLGKVVVHAVLTFVSLACFLPLMLVIAASFTSDAALIRHGYTLLPTEFSTYAYEFVLADAPRILHAYGVTLIVTAVGSVVALLVMSMLAYALSSKRLKIRKWLSFFVLFTLLFSGGLVPTYVLITQMLQMKNSLLVLILPIMVVPTYVLILRTYFAGLPVDLLDAARIDGAGEWRIFFQIVIPLSTPVLATIGLFCVLLYWNDWYSALLYIDNPQLYPLQYYLYTILVDITSLSSGYQAQSAPVPAQSARMALAVLAIGPIVFAAFFAHRYFVRGITIGALKD